jgi:dienelactone hydrolase
LFAGEYYRLIKCRSAAERPVNEQALAALPRGLCFFRRSHSSETLMDEKTESIARARVVLEVAGMESVILRSNIPYPAAPGHEVPTLDIRYPSVSAHRSRVPAVVFVSGYPDAGFEANLGCKHKDMQATVSWAELVAACGVAGVVYTNRDPAADVLAVFDYLERNGPSLGIDTDRIGVWACSGNVPNALSVLCSARRERLKCAVLCYGLMLDDVGASDVAEAAKAWGFVNPCAGKSVADLPDGVPLFIVRAGLDDIRGVNASIDRFVAKALALNKPLTLINVPDAPHAFDLFYDAESSREAIRCMLAFMRFHLLGT